MQNQDSIAKKTTITHYQTAAGILEATFQDTRLIKTIFVENEFAEKNIQSAPALPPLAMEGTEFQMKVWKATLQIPAGITVTYKQLATAIGQPKAFRAVANALGANKIAYFIPCHRVIRNDGKLGGYFWGIEIKAALLKSEGVKIAHRD